MNNFEEKEFKAQVNENILLYMTRTPKEIERDDVRERCRDKSCFCELCTYDKEDECYCILCNHLFEGSMCCECRECIVEEKL